MTAANTRHIPLYPELRACPAPSTERILEIFTDVTRHELHHDDQLVQTFEAELSPPATTGTRPPRRARNPLHPPHAELMTVGAHITHQKCGKSVPGLHRNSR